MPLYDRRCDKCRVIEVDVYAPRAKKLEKRHECGGTFRWKPSFGSVDSRPEFYDPAADKNYTSFHEMEKDARANGRAVMSKKEYDTHKVRSMTMEDRIDRNAPKRKEAIRKTLYRLQHGYKDSPQLPKESMLR